MILPFLIAALAAPQPYYAKTRHTPTPPPVAAPAPAPAQSGPVTQLVEPGISPKVEDGCGVLAVNPKEVLRTDYRDVPGFKVLNGPFALSMPKVDGPFGAIGCRRDTIVPGPGDGRVLLILQRPLILMDANRMGVLQMQNGNYVYRALQGELSQAERDAVLARLNILQVNYQAIVAQQRKAAAAGAPASSGDAPVATKKP